MAVPSFHSIAPRICTWDHSQCPGLWTQTGIPPDITSSSGRYLYGVLDWARIWCENDVSIIDIGYLCKLQGTEIPSCTLTLDVHVHTIPTAQVLHAITHATAAALTSSAHAVVLWASPSAAWTAAIAAAWHVYCTHASCVHVAHAANVSEGLRAMCASGTQESAVIQQSICTSAARPVGPLQHDAAVHLLKAAHVHLPKRNAVADQLRRASIVRLQTGLGEDFGSGAQLAAYWGTAGSSEEQRWQPVPETLSAAAPARVRAKRAAKLSLQKASGALATRFRVRSEPAVLCLPKDSVLADIADQLQLLSSALACRADAACQR